jgi:adenylate cyclase
MAANEEHTLGLIARDMQFMREQCWQFEGKVLKSTGDGLLMYFPSAVDAVKSALEIQNTFGRAAATLAADDVLKHRIGIQLGDVYLSETDAMGTGVNIAARLQLEAEPGTICVSQTVYDVVKSSLELEAEFLGTKELKNIAGSIGMYLIRPHHSGDQNENESHSFVETNIKIKQNPSAHDQPIADMELFDEVVANLEQSSDLLRIKRLILFACLHRWETSQEKLAKIGLKGLIAELIEVTQTADRLKELLSSIVHGTSKPELYTQIADSIISEVGWLYSGYQAISQNPAAQKLDISDRPAPVVSDPGIYDQIAAAIAVGEDPNRIKKIVHYLGRSSWDNKVDHLDRQTISELVQESHRLYPSMAELELALAEIIKVISKPKAYTAAASVLVRLMQPLYDRHDRGSGLSQAEVVPFVVAPEESGDQSDYDHGHSLGQLAANADPDPRNFADDLPLPPESVTDPQPPVAESAPEIAKSIDRETAIAQLDLFDLRLNIIKYVTPLRAKLLCFYTLYQNYGHNAQDLNNLRNYEFDNLLRELIGKYADFDRLNQALLQTASQFEYADQYTQTAQVLGAALKPIYSNLRSEPES